MSVRGYFDAGGPHSPDAARIWGETVSDFVDLGSTSNTYTIVQTSVGSSIEQRPSLSVFPGGTVRWLLFDEPGTANGPQDVEGLDIVFNISGVEWT